MNHHAILLQKVLNLWLPTLKRMTINPAVNRHIFTVLFKINLFEQW